MNGEYLQKTACRNSIPGAQIDDFMFWQIPPKSHLPDLKLVILKEFLQTEKSVHISISFSIIYHKNLDKNCVGTFGIPIRSNTSQKKFGLFSGNPISGINLSRKTP